MNTLHYTTTHCLRDWQTALESSSLTAVPDADAPIFGVIVVLNTQTLTTTPPIQDELLKNWAHNENWLVTPVSSLETDTLTFSAHKEVGAISDVLVYRYVISPNADNPAKNTKAHSIAHILDEQISLYLRRKLLPLLQQSTHHPEDIPAFELINHTQSALDCHILPISHLLRKHRLACFDMDSTLIKQEVIVELAKIAGIGDEVDSITEQAMRGEIDFATSFSRRVALLSGLDASVIDEICPLLIPQPGAFAAIAALKALGYRTALISGGFTPFAKHIAELLGIDEYHANPLEIENGKLTGEVLAPILDGNQKAKIVQKIASEMSIGLDEVVCIGDGANDLPMMAISDLGVAYHAKPIVQAKADVAINATGLEGVLYALGYPTLTAL